MRLFRPVSDYLERQLAETLYSDIGSESLFLEPSGEPGMVPHDGVTARIYSIPLTVFIGGISAVILELAEPRVRHGVWDHSIFSRDPVLRLRRTGLAAMVTFYGASSVAEKLISGVNDRHATISGSTPTGEAYAASDPELLAWVQATAAWGFISAYDRYVVPLSSQDWDAALAESQTAARAYGVPNPPVTRTDIDRLFGRTLHRLEPSQPLNEFLGLMRKVPALPPPGPFFQPLFVRAAIDLLPQEILVRTGLSGLGLKSWERPLMSFLARGSQLVRLRNHPYALQMRRLSNDAATR